MLVDNITHHQQAQERRRATLIVAACLIVGICLVAAAALPTLNQHEPRKQALTDIGVPLADANCRNAPTKRAFGNGDHRPTGEKVHYPDAPPAFGPHAATPQRMSRKYFTAADRPTLETLVHNLEHGFTILWYDNTIADNATLRGAVQAITAQFPSTTGHTDKFMAAPWTLADGAPFPGDAHVALSHWSNGSTNGNPNRQTGAWMYCSKPSGEAVAAFVHDYPFNDAPEGNAPG